MVHRLQLLQVHVTRTSRLTLLLAALAVTASACSAHGLAFRRDERVDIVSPRDRSKVALPVTVRWTTHDLDIGNGRAAFAVLIDRSPPAPGKTLESLIKDPGCRAQEGCPDAAYLAERNIFRTTDTSHVIERIGGLASDGQRERHEVTVIVLAPDGRRLGEQAYAVEFELHRDQR